jgi:hypothetical protein
MPNLRGMCLADQTASELCPDALLADGALVMVFYRGDW